MSNLTSSEQAASKVSLPVPVILQQLWQFMRPYKLRLVVATVALVFTASVTLSIGQGVRLLIDQGFIAQSSEALGQMVFIVIGLSVLMAVGTYVRFYCVSWLGERVTADIRAAVFKHLLTLHPSYFETNRSGEIMSRLTTDTSLLQNIIGSSFSMALRSSLTFVGALVLLLITNLKLTLLVFLGVPLVMAPILIFGRRVRKLSKHSQDSIADVGSYAGEIIQNIKVVQSYTREALEEVAFGKEVEQAFGVAKRRISQRALLIASVILLIFVAITALIWVGGNDMLAGHMSGGDLAAFVFYAIIIASAVATISEVYGELQRATGAAERLIELLKVPSQIPVSEGQSYQSEREKSAKLIQFQQVDFAYPSRPKVPALQGLNLTVEKGKSLALVGPSGAGKSTIFELLQRFYDPSQGRILLGEQDISQLTPQSLREQLAIVPQQPVLFTADIWHNIRYGKADATDEEVIAAAKAAHAHAFIENLPEGYSSFLGEQGTRLSGGQKQRIAIARAILNDPAILLLDEATSALDAESEYHVQQALETLMQNRTTIIIAHRLATIRNADSIAVLEHGKLLAQGTHNELLSSSALYRRLSDLQFKSE